jgi:hypothetical protein
VRPAPDEVTKNLKSVCVKVDAAFGRALKNLRRSLR